jgi:transcriptional regulatory protein LevR
MKLLNDRVNFFNIINNMKDAIGENIKIDEVRYIEVFKRFCNCLLNYGVKLNENIVVGLMLHIGCVLERVSNNISLKHLNKSENLMKDNMDKFLVVKEAVYFVEREFSVSFGREEYVYIMKIVYSL